MTETNPQAAPAERRTRYATAIRDEVRLRLGTNALALAERGQPVQMNFSEAETAADAAIAVADAEQAELRTAIARIERLALAFEVAGNEFIAERIREALGGDAASGPGRADGKTQQDEMRRCVCGDPIEWMDHPDDPGWIHSPGSDTPCLNAREPRQDEGTTADRDAALGAMLEGFGRLLATSSRDWGEYRVDAWLYAVICGWDCEETEHDETCSHGAMEEMQAQHGWSDEAVAKARRYRALVRALTEPAAVSQPGKEA